MANCPEPVFESTTITAISRFTPSGRAFGAFYAAISGLLGLVALREIQRYPEPSPLAFFAFVGAAALGCVIGLAYALLAATERRIVFDAKKIQVSWRYWWRGERTKTIPFSTVLSVGLVEIDRDDGVVFEAVLRLKGSRFAYCLWYTKPDSFWWTDQHRAAFLEQEPTIKRLTQLTGLPREDTPIQSKWRFRLTTRGS